MYLIFTYKNRLRYGREWAVQFFFEAQTRCFSWYLLSCPPPPKGRKYRGERTAPAAEAAAARTAPGPRGSRPTGASQREREKKRKPNFSSYGFGVCIPFGKHAEWHICKRIHDIEICKIAKTGEMQYTDGNTTLRYNCSHENSKIVQIQREEN